MREPTGAPVIELDQVGRDYPIEIARGSLYRTVRNAVGSGRKHRPIRQALADVSFTVRPGERVAVIGNNAAGKSTLLRIVAGLLRPTRGTVRVRGERVLLTSLGVGMMEGVSVLENTILYGALYGVEPARMRAEFADVVEWAGLAGYEHSPLKTLSTGSRARLAFSVIRHIATDIFLIDEALSAGDVTFRAKCRAFFDEQRNRERTFLVATHDMDFARSFCGTALWLHQGRLSGLGDSAEVVAAYLTAQGASPEKIRQPRNRASGQS
jgi:ABC-type polysaccharide/polyol phosphate transport system ATPase subunit